MVVCVRGFGFPGFFKSGPCQGRRQAPPPWWQPSPKRQPAQLHLECRLQVNAGTVASQKNLPLSTLNKRSLWESLFRPRTRPSKCAIPYFKAPNFFNYCCKLTPNWRPKCTPPCASAVAYCTGPTTLANPRLAPKRFLQTFNRDGAFAATCAASVQHRCR